MVVSRSNEDADRVATDHTGARDWENRTRGPFGDGSFEMDARTVRPIAAVHPQRLLNVASIPELSLDTCESTPNWR